MQRSSSSTGSAGSRGRFFSPARRLAPIRFQPDTVAQPSGGRKVLTGPCVISIHGLKKAETKFSKAHGDGTLLQTYMNEAADHFSNIKLPMGGQMTKVTEAFKYLQGQLA